MWTQIRLLLGPRSDCSSRSSLIRVHSVCLYAKIGLKSLQEYSADDINRRHFQGFLDVLRVKRYNRLLALIKSRGLQPNLMNGHVWIKAHLLSCERLDESTQNPYLGKHDKNSISNIFRLVPESFSNVAACTCIDET